MSLIVVSGKDFGFNLRRKVADGLLPSALADHKNVRPPPITAKVLN